MVAIEKGKLPSDWSAQACELYALKRALEILTQERRTVYTDSKYAFEVVHTFGKIWEERGLLNSKGKGLVHEKFIVEVLETLQLPEVAVVYVKGHQKEVTLEAQRNSLAELEAKNAAESGTEKLMMMLTPTSGEMQEVPAFSEMEERELLRIGAKKDNEGNWRLPDERQLLNLLLRKC